MSSDDYRHLLDAIERTRDEELACDEVIALAVRYLHAAPLPEPMRHHLSLCPECREEFDELLSLVDEGVLPASKAQS